MPGPGEYRPDPTIGIARTEDLPKTKVSVQSRNYRRRPCPHCGSQGLPRSARPPHPSRPGQHPHRAAPRHRPALFAALLPPLPQVLQRRLHPTWPTPAAITPAGSSTSPSGWSSRTACPIAPPNGPSGATTACSSPTPRSRTGSRPGGKRRRDGSTPSISTGPSPTSRAIIAVDELYDGPFCVLSIVDNRTFKRLTYQVLDHDPDPLDITAFFRRFHRALTARGLTLKGITTDGSALYPEPIAAVFGEIPHQLCTFHILREVTKAVLSAVAQERKRLAATRTEAAAGPASCHQGRTRRGPAQEADRAEGRRALRPPLPVRPEASESLRAGDVAADQPRVAPVPPVARADGRGLPAVRPPVPDGHGVGQAGRVAGPVAAVQEAAVGA